MQLERAIRQVIKDWLAREYFSLRYQPQLAMAMATGSVVGMEALLYWQAP